MITNHTTAGRTVRHHKQNQSREGGQRGEGEIGRHARHMRGCSRRRHVQAGNREGEGGGVVEGGREGEC